MAWLMLLVAGLLEVTWAPHIKLSVGFTRLWPSIIRITTMVMSVALLSWSMRTVPLSIAYTVWTGIGGVGAFVVDIFVFGEPASPYRLVAGVLIVGGLILMKMSSPA